MFSPILLQSANDIHTYYQYYTSKFNWSVIYRYSHIKWCPTRIVFCLCFVFLRLRLCCQFLRVVHCWLPCRYSLFKAIQKTGDAKWQMVISESFDVWIKLTIIISTVVVKKQQNIFIFVVIIQDRVI